MSTKEFTHEEVARLLRQLIVHVGSDQVADPQLQYADAVLKREARECAKYFESLRKGGGQ